MTKSKPVVWGLRVVMAIVSMGCLVVFVPWMAAYAYLTPLPDTVQQQVEDAVGYDLDGIIVYVDRKGHKSELYSAGWNNKEQKIPADPNKLFKIGSISKLYIAAAAAKLISAKKLSLDHSLTHYFPELTGQIEHADQITLRMLLQHRSGIPDWIDSPKFPWATSLPDVRQYLELVLNEPAEFAPDSRYHYSNTNYVLVGNILDKTLGYAHQTYIKNEILTPLGLTNTYGLLNDVKPENLSSGYHRGYNGDVKMLDIVAPGGSMLASAQDVAVFLRALNDGSLLSGNEQAIYSSVYLYEHTGLWPGYSAIARYHKDIDTVVIQFVNTSGDNSWTLSEIVYDRIIQILRK